MYKSIRENEKRPIKLRCNLLGQHGPCLYNTFICTIIVAWRGRRYIPGQSLACPLNGFKTTERWLVGSESIQTRGCCLHDVTDIGINNYIIALIGPFLISFMALGIVSFIVLLTYTYRFQANAHSYADYATKVSTSSRTCYGTCERCTTKSWAPNKSRPKEGRMKRRRRRRVRQR